MRNLKKILALVMALVMSLSLVTIANASDFTDSDDITYEEAADVMNAIGIIEGFEDGSFDPDGTLTREQAATLVTRMLLGDNADRLGVEDSTFDDVAVTRWSAPYIEYCASLGLIDGAGDGNFYPAGQLTGYAFAKILLTAIGYSSEAEGLTGTSWSVNTAALAMSVGLDDGLENGISSAVLSREEAAQMALNAICTPLVAYDDGVTVIVDGTPVTVGSGDAYYITTTLAREQRISEATLSNTKEYTVEFGEKYFPDLRLVDDPDEFNRPCHTWVYENEEIGSYVDYDLLLETYTESITGADLYSLLGRTTIADYDIAYYVDGALEEDVIKASNMIRTNTRTYATTGNGVLTQVFVDHAANDGDGEITITSINTYLAQAEADYNETRGELSLDVFQASTNYNVPDTTVDEVDFPQIVDYKDGDYMLVNLALSSGSRYEIVRINDVDVMTDSTVTKFSRNNYLVTGGEEYDYAKQGRNGYDVAMNNDAVNDLDSYNDDLLTNFTYNIYLDQYGYVIGVKEYAGEANYLFLTGYDLNGSNLAVTDATGGAIFLDGSFERIQIDVDETDENLDVDEDDIADSTYYPFLRDGVNVDDGMSQYNKWFTYTTTTNRSGETVYTLSPVDNWLEVDAPDGVNGEEESINCASVRLIGSAGEGVASNRVAYSNDDSVYLTVDTGVVDRDTGNGITDVTGIYTGVQNVDLDLYSYTALVGETADNVLDATDVNRASDPDTTKGIFAVYDDDQYIIAAVVVGEDANNTDKYAYALEGAQSETYEDGYYYWDFYAVVDGEIELLTVKTKYTSVIDEIEDRVGSANIGANGLLVLTYDADGYVVEAAGCDSDNLADTIYSNADWGNATLADDDYDAYRMQFTTTWDADLTYAGSTLYSRENNANDIGLHLASGAPVIVVQNEEDNDDGDLHLTYAAYSNLRQALSVLDGDGEDYYGWVTAVLNDNGDAQYIVLKAGRAVGVETDDPDQGHSGRNIRNETLSLTGAGHLRVDWDIINGAYNTANFTTDVVFYRLENGVSYEVGRADYDGALGATGNYLQSPRDIQQNGYYYAEITITDTTTNDVVDSAVTDAVPLAY